MNKHTLGTISSVLFSEVSWFQGLNTVQMDHLGLQQLSLLLRCSESCVRTSKLHIYTYYTCLIRGCVAICRILSLSPDHCIPSLATAHVESLPPYFHPQELDLRLNPVTKHEPDYRLFVVHMLVNLRKLGKFVTQWDPSNPDTLGTIPRVLFSEVSWFQRWNDTQMYYLWLQPFSSLLRCPGTDKYIPYI